MRKYTEGVRRCGSQRTNPRLSKKKKKRERERRNELYCFIVINRKRSRRVKVNEIC
jgi:hypothetical protein